MKIAPPDLAYSGEGHTETPARAGLIALKLAEQLTGNPIPCEMKNQITGITLRSQSRVLSSHSPRRLHNIPDSGPEPRGHVTGNTAAIATYVDNPSTSMKAKAREDWRIGQQEERLYPEDWFNTVHCDEFHVGIGTQTTNRIKRKRGQKHRYAPHNVHRKRISSKDVKAKAREDAYLKLFNVFVLVGYNYRKTIPYDTGKLGGKMNSKCDTEQILPQILDDFRFQGLILVHDSDSAHVSEETTRWVEAKNLEVLALPGVSPDFSVFESLAAPLKKRFHTVRSATYEGALKRFHKVFITRYSSRKCSKPFQ